MDDAGARLFGLPVYTSKWMPGELIVMANRPHQNLTGSELTRLLEWQLAGTHGRQTFGRWMESKAAQPAPLDTSPYLTTPSPLWSQPVLSSTQNVETVFRVGADGRPEAVTRLVDKPSPTAVRNAGESDLAWLHRRVAEICWRPR